LTAVLVVFGAVDYAGMVDARHPDMALRYRGYDYIEKGLLYVPPDEVEFTNWWTRACRAGDGFTLLEKVPMSTDTWVGTLSYEGRPIHDAENFVPQIAALASSPDTPRADLVALGMALAARVGSDAGQFHYVLGGAGIDGPALDAIWDGFRRFAAGPPWSCPEIDDRGRPPTHSAGPSRSTRPT
jgi:hypothetical protein